MSLDLNKLNNLGTQYSALVVTPITDLNPSLIEITKAAVAEDKPILFISFNRPQESVARGMEAQSIKTDKIFFIDCISKSLGNVTRKKNVIHIESASDLTALNIAVNEFYSKIPGPKYVIVDALATLLIYSPEELVVKFVRSVLEGAQESKIACFTPNAKGEGFIDRIGPNFDLVMYTSQD